MGVGTWTRRAAAAVLTFAPLPLAQPTAHAQSPAEFYRGGTSSSTSDTALAAPTISMRAC